MTGGWGFNPPVVESYPPTGDQKCWSGVKTSILPLRASGFGPWGRSDPHCFFWQIDHWLQCLFKYFHWGPSHPLQFPSLPSVLPSSLFPFSLPLEVGRLSIHCLVHIFLFFLFFWTSIAAAAATTRSPPEATTAVKQSVAILFMKWINYVHKLCKLD